MKYYLKKAILFVLIAVLSLMIIGCGKKEPRITVERNAQ